MTTRAESRLLDALYTMARGEQTAKVDALRDEFNRAERETAVVELKSGPDLVGALRHVIGAVRAAVKAHANYGDPEDHLAAAERELVASALSAPAQPWVGRLRFVSAEAKGPAGEQIMPPTVVERQSCFTSDAGPTLSQSEQAPELKPCPLCRKPAALVGYYESGKKKTKNVYCPFGCRISVVGDDAFERWNRRVPDPLVAELESCIERQRNTIIELGKRRDAAVADIQLWKERWKTMRKMRDGLQVAAYRELPPPYEPEAGK